jgi:hypothetical protein
MKAIYILALAALVIMFIACLAQPGGTIGWGEAIAIIAIEVVILGFGRYVAMKR